MRIDDDEVRVLVRPGKKCPAGFETLAKRLRKVIGKGATTVFDVPARVEDAEDEEDPPGEVQHGTT